MRGESKVNVEEMERYGKGRCYGASAQDIAPVPLSMAIAPMTKSKQCQARRSTTYVSGVNELGRDDLGSFIFGS